MRPRHGDALNTTSGRAWLGNRLWQLASWPEQWRFQRGLEDLRETQERLLANLLYRQSSTAYGQRHALRGDLTYQQFRELAPLSTYETLVPYLREPKGLCPTPVIVWEPTGGSSGGSKWIPWTSGLQIEFRRAVAVWIWHLFRNYPEVIAGRGYWQLTPRAEILAPDWLSAQRTGFEKDGDYLGPLGRWLERSVLLSPPPGHNFWARTVRTLRAASDLRLVSCWSPSFLLCLRDHFLEELGQWEPTRWWPRLRLISCWTAAGSALYRECLEELFPGVAIQPKGLLSTEAVVTIPLGSRLPLAYRSHFFELAVEGTVLPAWEWEVGQEGAVLVSTGNGLTRYQTGDRVRVVDRLGRVPCLEFLGRDGVSDQRGEKLSHAFLESLLRELPGFAMLAFEGDGYVLFLDQAESARQRAARVRALENALSLCYTYRDCRHLGQLSPLRGFLVQGDALSQYGQICAWRLGQREGSAKAMAFHPYQGWSRQFAGGFLEAF